MPFNINEFRSHISNKNEFAYADKFEVIVPTPFSSQYSRDLTFQCEVAELPGKNVNMVEFRHYGFIKRIPHHITYPDISITFLCNGNMTERKLFDYWYEQMIPSESGLVKYQKSDNVNNYNSDITIIQYSHIGANERIEKVNDDERIIQNSERLVGNPKVKYDYTKIYQCKLIDAIPVSMSSLPLNWGDNSIHKLNVTFAYKKWITEEISSPEESGLSTNSLNDLMTRRGALDTLNNATPPELANLTLPKINIDI